MIKFKYFNTKNKYQPKKKYIYISLIYFNSIIILHFVASFETMIYQFLPLKTEAK